VRKLTLSHKEDQTDYDHDGCFHSILKKVKTNKRKKGNAKIKIYTQWNSIQLFSPDKTTVSPFSLRTLKKHENLVTPALYDRCEFPTSQSKIIQVVIEELFLLLTLKCHKMATLKFGIKRVVQGQVTTAKKLL